MIRILDKTILNTESLVYTPAVSPAHKRKRGSTRGDGKSLDECFWWWWSTVSGGSSRNALSRDRFLNIGTGVT
jgi:hypothetical protein